MAVEAETLHSPLEGTVCSIKVHAQDRVQAGQAILGIRDSHMLHLIAAEAEAEVDRLLVREGQFVKSGQPLVAMHDDPIEPQPKLDGDPEDMSSWKLV